MEDRLRQTGEKRTTPCRRWRRKEKKAAEISVTNKHTRGQINTFIFFLFRRGKGEEGEIPLLQGWWQLVFFRQARSESGFAKNRTAATRVNLRKGTPPYLFSDRICDFFCRNWESLFSTCLVRYQKYQRREINNGTKWSSFILGMLMNLTHSPAYVTIY